MSGPHSPFSNQVPGPLDMHHHKWSWDISERIARLGRIGYVNHARKFVCVCELVFTKVSTPSPHMNVCKKKPHPCFFFSLFKVLIQFGFFLICMFSIIFLFEILIHGHALFHKEVELIQEVGSNTPILGSSKYMWHMKYAPVTKLWPISTFESQKCQMCVFEKWH